MHQMTESKSVPAVGTTTLAPTLVFLVLIVAGLVVMMINRGGLMIEDDSYYYSIVAKNLAASGLSTFDGQTLTNGYHPLWLLLVTLLTMTVGLSDPVLAVTEVVLATGGVWFFLSVFRAPSLALKLTFVTFFAVLATPLVARGMEISLLIFALGLFTRIAVAYFERRTSAAALGLAAIFCIGARLDAAAFVVPIVLLASGSWRRACLPMAMILIAGAIYAGVNLWIFGIAFPVSGAIKSLGGLQLNRPFLIQATAPFAEGGPVRSLLGFLRSTPGKLALLFVLTVVALPFLQRRWKSWPIGLGFAIGMILYATKLLFGSSWVIWSWYGFPMFLGLFAVFNALDDRATYRVGSSSPLLRTLMAGVVVLGGLGWIARSNGLGQPPASGFEAVNLEAAKQFAPIFEGARVAMGDRAGSFAAYYGGPVTQLEGLVNDKAYLDALSRKEDLKPLLCARGVRYVLAYQVDLGAYDTVEVPVLRRALTQFEAPALVFSKQDEVGRVSDLAKFEVGGGEEADNYLYAWRLSGCPVGS
jgi:hypothetical protein